MVQGIYDNREHCRVTRSLLRCHRQGKVFRDLKQGFLRRQRAVEHLVHGADLLLHVEDGHVRQRALRRLDRQEFRRHAERGHHGDAVVALDLAAVADGGHLLVEEGGGLAQRALLVGLADQAVGLAQDGHVEVDHCTSSFSGDAIDSATSAGIFSSNASTRSCASLRRFWKLRLSITRAALACRSCAFSRRSACVISASWSILSDSSWNSEIIPTL